MIATVFREGDRIRDTSGQGYADRVSDDLIRGHMPHQGSQSEVHDAFCRAVLAIRAYERLAFGVFRDATTRPIHQAHEGMDK